jgi:hypothetical protein
MTLKCSHCGAPLRASPDQAVVECAYCHTLTRIGSHPEPRPPEPRPPEPPPRGASQGRIVGLLVGSAICAGTIVAIIALSRSLAVTRASDGGAASARPAPGSADVGSATAAAPQVGEPKPEPKTGSDPAAVAAAPARPQGKPRKPAVEPAPTGPILTKEQATEVLRPEVLSCMKEHGVHYLITRLGNEPRGGIVPPLGLTETSVVDYKPTPGFAATPLGRCVARAARAVRAPAYGGNYIYLGLRNESIPDPLADAPARLDVEAAKQVLATFEDEARDCTTRSPVGSRPGESTSVAVTFEGATGKVSRVEPYYVDTRSPYGRCLFSVYSKANAGKFRDIDQRVVYVLRP